MSITLTYLIKSLIIPPLSLLILAMIGLLYRHSHWGGRVAWVSIAAIFFLSLPIVVDLWAKAWEVYPPVQTEVILAFKPEALIVIGGGATTAAEEYQKQQTINARTLLRIRYAAKLAKDWALPILVSGGSVVAGDDQQPESALMADVLTEEFHIPMVWQETRSRNTAENAQYSHALLQEYAINKVLLVTQAYHMPRAVDEFRRAGFFVLPAPTAFIYSNAHVNLFDFLPSTTALMNSSLLAHEGLGLLWYRIRTATRL